MWMFFFNGIEKTGLRNGVSPPPLVETAFNSTKTKPWSNWVNEPWWLRKRRGMGRRWLQPGTPRWWWRRDGVAPYRSGRCATWSSLIARCSWSCRKYTAGWRRRRTGDRSRQPCRRYWRGRRSPGRATGGAARRRWSHPVWSPRPPSSLRPTCSGPLRMETCARGHSVEKKRNQVEVFWATHEIACANHFSYFNTSIKAKIVAHLTIVE